MARNNKKKLVHVSPGIYFSERELQIATKSLGITNLGIAGETVKGPAFQPIQIGSWSQFQSYFGGTNTEKYRGSQYPKYEAPYIAKTFLEQSQNLKVCRVLGLSGVNAGPAWVITAYGEENSDYTENNPMVIAVLRSRGEHQKAALVATKGETDPETGNELCEDKYEYDKILYYAKNIEIERINSLVLNDECETSMKQESEDLEINVNNYGRFALKVTRFDGEVSTYAVSLNPSEKNYIYNVIGSNPEVGDSEIYIEELYDIALQQLIERGKINKINGDILPKFNIVRFIPKYAPCDAILNEDETMLKRKDVGKRFLYSVDESIDAEGNSLKIHKTTDNGVTWVAQEGEEGHIYTVIAFTTEEGTRKYYYAEDATENADKVEVLQQINETKAIEDEIADECVFVNSDSLYYVLDSNGKITSVLADFNNYKEQYRFSSTPWIVSEVKGSANNIELTKLFRFHTISDGDNSVTEIKISIENIEPDLGTFDVLVRDFYDTDASPAVLERYRNCNLVPGTENYIGLKIGTFDETYETKSNYITVEVNETDKTKLSVPAGFLGYPVRDYSKKIIGAELGCIEKLQKPFLQYNTNVNDDIRIKKQYFGMSDLMGIDGDVLKYKGVEAYNGLPSGLTPCFHLDSRILEGQPNKDGIVNQYNIEQTVTVDGVKGYEWVTVGKGNTVGNFGIEPRLGNDAVMMNTIYEDKRYRKFTLCFYGGFDGWDYYRTSRSNSDDFKYQKYRGKLNTVSGEGANFSVISNPEAYGFDKSEKVITSDYYAYLSAIRQFANPKETDINVFATPGIDYVNQNLLVQETIEMIEEERADSIYVLTTPDKPYGASDNKSEMFTAEDAVDNLEASEIDTNWGCTYFPWIKYFDASNNQYIYLPPTRDVVKNFAYTDNISAPWFSASGWNRGITDGVRSKKNLVLSEQDELYAGRINFINNFADEGMRIWGNNNLQIEPSNAHMNKITTRRCLIRLRKLISIACIGLLFEPNDATTVASFRSAVEPILEDFIAKRALVDAKLVIDDSQEALDRLEINAQLYLKFVPTLEYINIGLVATPQGVSFDDI